MPLYDYKCKKCNHEFSETLRLSEYGQTKVKCPKCDSADVVRLLSVVSLRNIEEKLTGAVSIRAYFGRRREVLVERIGLLARRAKEPLSSEHLLANATINTEFIVD